MRFIVMIIFTLAPLIADLLLFLLMRITGIHDIGIGSKGIASFLTYLAYFGGYGWLITVPIGAGGIIVLVIQEICRPAPRLTAREPDPAICKLCPYCNEGVLATSNYCMQCGKHFSVS